jgi:hypothetical protein
MRAMLGGDIVWALLTGLVTTLASGYVFGETNQLAQLYRWADPTFLTADWFVNATDEFSPQVYYLTAVAGLLQVVPIEPLLALLTVLGNAGLGLVTCRAVRDLAPSSAAAPRLAGGLVLGVLAFGTGGATHLARQFVEPSLLARPLALGGLWGLLGGGTVWPFAFFATAIAIHPLVGAETAAVVALAGVSAWVTTKPRSGSFPWRYLWTLAGLAIWSWLLWGGRYGSSADIGEFRLILAEIRHPHHYLPSTFEPESLAALAVFFAAAGTAWWSWQRQAPDPELARTLAWAMGWVAIGCFAGWLFVEVWPLRWAIVAQTFRLTYLLKWLGFMLIAANAVRWWNLAETSHVGRGALRLAAAVSLLGFGKLYALGALCGQLAGHAAEHETIARSVRRAAASLAFVDGLAMLVPLNQRTGEPVVSWAILGLAVLWSTRVVRPILRGAVTLAIVVLLSATLLLRNTERVQRLAAWLGTSAPGYRWADQSAGYEGIERWAREHSPRDAIFVVPPFLGRFRIGAERAIVVDFKGMPFSDDAQREWYERLRACCLPEDAQGVPGQEDFFLGYREIDDERLRLLRDKYGATFAVIINGTPTSLPTVYADELFTLVSLVG